MVKSFLIRLQGPVCVYAHCKILVIPGSVGLYNVPHRFNWVVSIPVLDWGIWHWHTYTHLCIHIYIYTHTHIYINYSEKVKISAVSFAKIFLMVKACLAFSRFFFPHFPSVAFSPFFGLHRIISYIQRFTSPGKKHFIPGWGHNIILPIDVKSSPFPCPSDNGLSHILTHCPSQPATFSWPSHQSTWKPRRTLAENW